MFKAGYITVVGKPNAGKSTLVNKLVGFKVAITTPKPQTTRFNIKGIVTSKTSQMIFIDTPGVHTPEHKLGKYMMKGVQNAISNVDLIIYLIDASKPKMDMANEKIMQDIVKTKKNVILVINKVDIVEKEKILKIIEVYTNYFKSINGEFKEIIPISVYKNDGLDILIENIEKYLPEGEPFYEQDEITDITQKELVEEIIREKALNSLLEEVPHGIKVEVEKFKERENENGNFIYDIEANIICNKESHKGIIIGKDGQCLKKIKTLALKDIKEALDGRVNLKLWVKVRKNWQQNENYLKDIKNKIC